VGIASPILPVSDHWARRLSRRPLASATVTLLCLGVLVALLWGDRLAGSRTTFGGLTIVPLIVGGWLLGWRVALGLTAAGMALRLAAISAAGLDPTTGAIQAFVALSVGLLTIAAADRAEARALMERRARGVRRLTRLVDAIRALGTEGDADLSLEEILAAAAAVLAPTEGSPPRAVLAVVEDGQLTATLERAPPGASSILGATMPVAGNPSVARVLEDGGTVVVRRRQVRGLPSVLVDEQKSAGVTVLARVRAGGRAHGVLSVGFEEARRFDPEELRLLEAMGHLAGIAIDSATAVRLEHEHAEHNAELEASKRDFLLLASHELRSPLAVARGYAAMLRDGSLGPPPPSFGRPLEVMEAKLDEIGGLVDDMLEAARLETGNLILIQGDVDLRAVVQTAVDCVRPGVTERHQLEVELPGKPVVVRGDTERLRRIAVNLLDNAVKYSPDGGPVRCLVGVADDGSAVLRVRDCGIGIPDDAMERMFRRFGRIVTPQTRGIPGTGLGLYLCRELARAHGGDITVQSDEGKGSTFTLSLPSEAQGLG
jgi:signal transduction histidine kinase